MIRTTKSGLGRYTVAQIKDAVSKDGIQLYSGTNKTSNDIAHIGPIGTTQSSFDTNKLVDLVLKARNETRGDSAHVSSAQSLVNSWLSSSTTPSEPSTPQNPTTPSTPSTPSTPTTANVSRPNWVGDWTPDISAEVKNICNNLSSGQSALFVLYNIPGRDNGNYSKGGLSTASAYADWVKKISDAIGSSKAICIVEPDALGLMDGLPTQQLKDERYSMLTNAVKTLRTNANTKVFVDASTWVGPDEMAKRLKAVNGGSFDGFSCNVSGYTDTPSVSSWADNVFNASGLRYIIDTSRNGYGNPHPPAWCNVTDTKVGVQPQMSPTPNCLAYLWVKVPGESDGLKINGYDNDGQQDRHDIPTAGGEWPEFKTAIYSGQWTDFKRKYNIT